MQQKAFEESRYPWQESFENVAVCLPFRCPRDTDLVTSSEPLKQGKLQSCGNIVKQKPSYVNLYSISHEHSKDRKPFEVVAERPVSYVQTYTTVDLRADSLDGPRSSPGLPTSETKTAFEAHVREKFNRMVEAVDRTIEKRIDKLTRELAQKTAELLEVRAAFVQLTQKKQEVQRREQALNRQVDVAVEMIAVLRQRLTESEEELLRKEEEVVTFNHFLEAAAEKEVQGKARLQDFIENLLHRVELAEKQLEYYHSQQAAGLRRDATEHVEHSRHHLIVLPQPCLCDTDESKTPARRSYLKKAKDDRASMQPAKSMHEQAESPREFCRPAKKGEPLGFSRKGNIKPKMAKKKPTAIVNII
ncbi:protein ZNF365 [Camelus ferus]|nr:protein ZNF365 [Camelus ferus]